MPCCYVELSYKRVMNERTLVAFFLSLSGGLWMIASSRIVYGGLTPTGNDWGMGNMMFGHGMFGQFGLWWPWFGGIAGTIIVISAALLYLAPRYRRTLSTTILMFSILNLFFGMGGGVASVLSMAGGVVGFISKKSFRK